MKGTGLAFGRTLRWVMLLICGGGVVLAVESSRFGSNHAGQRSIFDWLSSFSWDEKTAVVTAPAVEPANPSRISLSTNLFLHRLLFARPAANGWRLDPSKEEPSSAWLTQPGAPVVSARSADYPVSTMFSSSDFPRVSARDWISAPDGGPPPPGQTGNWIANASGNWGTAANWQSGTIPSGPASKAHFDTLNLTTNVTVTIETNRTVGELYIGDTNGSNSYTIAPNGATSLTFDNAGNASVLVQSSTSAGDTISVPLLLKNDLFVSNDSSANPLEITGNIASSAPSGTGQTLGLSGGQIFVSGDITPGSTGADLGLQISGDVNLSGTNTYGGSTFVTGMLFVKGDNSGATGQVQVFGGGSLLSGIGTVGGHVTIFGGTITGGTTTETGRLTLTQGLDLSASEGGGGTYLANLSDDISDRLVITGNFNIGSGTTLDIQGMADGTTTYTLATFGSLTGMFDDVLGLPQGYNLVYLPNELDLVPIPEPATWIGGGLALGALFFGRRKRNAKIRR